MTVQQIDIPSEYKPYNKVIFCSNTLINVRYLFEDKSFFPILIGSGSIPKVWIYTKDPNNKPLLLVKKSISTYPLISVNINDDIKRLTIILTEKNNKITMLDINYASNEAIIVESINLKPIGYNIVGSKDSLNIGNIKVSNNTLQNVHSFIGLG